MTFDLEGWATTGSVALSLVAAAGVFVVLGLLASRRRDVVDAGTSKTEVLSREKNEPCGSTAPISSPAAKEEEPQLCVAFGSQTGTAESFSRSFARSAESKGLRAKIVDLEEFELERLKKLPCVVLIVATYGEGDPTDNAMAFAAHIKELEDDALSSLKFAVFGLGSTQYEHYNKMGKDTDKRLAQAGAQRLLPLGLGNDAAGSLEQGFEEWSEKCLKVLVDTFSPQTSAPPAVAASTATSQAPAVNLPDLPFTLEFMTNGSAAKVVRRVYSASDSTINASTKYYFFHSEVKVAVNRELRSTQDGGSTRHIELSLEGAQLEYTTADNVAVLPENDSDMVKSLAKCQGYDLDVAFNIEGPKALFPTPCTVREALTVYFDLKGIPRRTVLAQLAVYATDAAQRERLKHLASKQGREEYNDVVVKEGRSLYDLITETFPSLSIPFDHLVALAPHLQPRYYTISSSSTVHGRVIHATVAVTETKLPSGRVHKGLCSSYLASLPVGSKVRIFVRPSSFRLPASPSTPVILVGPGTGIAPMRALLQERRYQRVVEGKPVGPTHMFFGCRRRDTDFLYEEELTQYAADGTLSHLHLAFSRETTAKVYVQHLMLEHATSQELWELIDGQEGHVYVCGGTAMGQDVHRALEIIVQKAGGLSMSEASAYIKRLQKATRYVAELWSA